MIADKIGYGFSGTRNDGRFFSGEIVRVSENAKGTLVVLKSNGVEFKSVYIQDMKHYCAALNNGQPVSLPQNG